MSVDVLFTGGDVFTGSGEPVTGMSVGVTAGKISAIVPDSEAASFVGPNTQTVNLNGALLSPGFQDAHVHPTTAGVELLQCDLSGTETAEEAVATVAAYAAANPDEEWVLGGGWSMDHFPGGAPTRELLDKVVSDRPVLVMSRDHHSAWANTVAIELASLDKTTEDPFDGRIERESDGFPAGTFHEGAMDLFNNVAPQTTDDLAYQGLLRAQEELLSFGITGWQDAIVGGDTIGKGTLEAYDRALKEKTLIAHVVGAQWWDRNRGLEQIDEIISRRDAQKERGSINRFDLGTVKIMLDGVAENFTASMLEPYRDTSGHNTCNHGISFIDNDVLREAVARLDAAGMQLHFHALGDRAVRDALDALEEARAKNGETDGRHHLAHLQMIAESDTPRFAVLNATANIQALWASHEDQLDELTLPFLQDGAVARHYPFGELQQEGARLAAGSDWPVSSANPLEAIDTAVNRTIPNSDSQPLGGAHQTLDLATAFAAYTSGSAYVNHREHDTGSIREGYLANLAVIEPNPFTLPKDEIHTAQVTSTWIEGAAVYTKTA